MNKTQTTWQPEHFPIGTLVKLDAPDLDLTRGDTFVVLDIIRTGPNRYYLKVNRPHPVIADALMGVNLNRVSRIVWRGDGGLGHAYTVRDSALSTSAELPISSVKKKSHYFRANIDDILAHVTEKYMHGGAVLDMTSMRHAYSKTGQVKPGYLISETISQWEGYAGKVHKVPIAVSVPKKKVHAWVKRNINRFLVNPQKAQARYDDFWREDMRDSWGDVSALTDEFIPSETASVPDEATSTPIPH